MSKLSGRVLALGLTAAITLPSCSGSHESTQTCLDKGSSRTELGMETGKFFTALVFDSLDPETYSAGVIAVPPEERQQSGPINSDVIVEPLAIRCRGATAAYLGRQANHLVGIHVPNAEYFKKGEKGNPDSILTTSPDSVGTVVQVEVQADPSGDGFVDREGNHFGVYFQPKP